MFSSLFGAKKLTPDEEKIQNSEVYKSLTTEDQKKGFMKAALNEISIYKRRNLFPVIEEVKVKLNGIDSDLFIHSIKYPKRQTSKIESTNTNELPSVLLLHGYGGTSLSFYKLINLFQDQYDAYAIDYLGMGLSTHHNFHLTEVDDINNYFIESIEQWRIAKGINKLIIVGHSFGGYMGFNYALKYQERILELFLVSPMGGTMRTQEEVDQWAKTRQDGYFKQKLFNYFTSAWHEKKTISTFFKMPLVPTYFMLNNYIKNRLKIEEEYRSDWYDYMTGLIELPDSSDRGIFYLLRFPRMSAIQSIEEILKKEVHEMKRKLNFHIHFLYGDNDWMCSDGANRIIEQQTSPSSFMKVKDATHNVVYDQPKIIHNYITQSLARANSTNQNK